MLILLSLPILFGFSIPLSELGARIFSQREINLQGMPLESLLREERKHRQAGNQFLFEFQYEKALDEYNKALTIIPYKFETLYNKACILALLDKKQEALQTLKLAALIHNYAIDLASDDPDLDNLRDMAQFQEFITWEEK
jgi:tetratricopeptide (TPR) repeat protein